MCDAGPIGCVLAPTCSLLSAGLILPTSSRRLTLALGKGRGGVGGSSFIITVGSVNLRSGVVRGIFGGFSRLRSG